MLSSANLCYIPLPCSPLLVIVHFTSTFSILALPSFKFSILFYLVLHFSTFCFLVLQCPTLIYLVVLCLKLFPLVLFLPYPVLPWSTYIFPFPLCSTLFTFAFPCSTMFFLALPCTTLFNLFCTWFYLVHLFLSPTYSALLCLVLPSPAFFTLFRPCFFSNPVLPF